MNEQTIALLREMADKFGTTVEHLWGVLIKQAYISAITNAGFAVMLFLAAVLGARWAIKTWNSKPSYLDDSNTGRAVVIALSFAALLFAFACASSAVTCLLNPEYYALTKILNQ